MSSSRTLRHTQTRTVGAAMSEVALSITSCPDIQCRRSKQKQTKDWKRGMRGKVVQLRRIPDLFLPWRQREVVTASFSVVLHSLYKTQRTVGEVKMHVSNLRITKANSTFLTKLRLWNQTWLIHFIQTFAQLHKFHRICRFHGDMHHQQISMGEECSWVWA